MVGGEVSGSQHHQPSGSNQSEVYELVGSLPLTSPTCWGFLYLQNSSKMLLCMSLYGKPGPCPKVALLFLFFKKKKIIFIYGCVGWVFVSMRGLSLVVASGGHSSSRCTGLSLSRPLLLPSTGSRRAGSVIVAHGPSCSAACGIFPDQGSNACPLHWQADSQPLRHQGSPIVSLDCSSLVSASPPFPH